MPRIGQNLQPSPKNMSLKYSKETLFHVFRPGPIEIFHSYMKTSPLLVKTYAQRSWPLSSGISLTYHAYCNHVQWIKFWWPETFGLEHSLSFNVLCLSQHLIFNVRGERMPNEYQMRHCSKERDKKNKITNRWTLNTIWKIIELYTILVTFGPLKSWKSKCNKRD